MPTITGIKQLKRRQSRFSVYVDGKYAFAIGDLDLSAQGFTVGKEVSQGEINHWKEQGGQSRAFDLALGYVGVRARSVKEIQGYLEKKEVGEELAQDVLERLEELGLADDVAFAQGWVEARQKSRPRSRRLLDQELTAKGVPKDVISSVLEADFDRASELASAMAVISKKRRLPQYRSLEKLIAYMLRQGYPYEVVKRALETSES
jgi:regulatory protein